MATIISGTTGVTYPAGGVDNTAGAGVGTTDTQTLTNKTLSSSTLTSPTINGTPVMGASVITAKTAVTASGTAVDFTDIPSWVKRITVMFNGVSTNGTSIPLLQLGSGSAQATGYFGQSSAMSNSTATTSSTSGFPLYSIVATNTISGAVMFVNITSNVWACSGCVTDKTSSTIVTAGNVTLSGALDRIRITTVNGTDTFDAGSINIMYE